MNRELIPGLLRGQEICIPNLGSVFDHWPCERSSHYEALMRVVDLRLESVVKDSEKLQRLKKADFALFTCCWWPLADFERSRIVAYLIIWLFLWDDEIDESSGSLTNNFNDSQAYRARTSEFVEECLGLREHNLVNQDLHPYITSFAPIGNALRAAFTRAQARRFMAEIIIFMDASEAEQRHRINGQVMDLETYWKIRLGTSAVGVCSAVIDYVNKDAIPVELAASQHMQTIWHETNMIVSIVNDVLSLQKELRKGGIDSLIPLTVAMGTPVQEAIDIAVVDLKSSVSRFDEAAISLMKAIDGPRSTWNRLRGHWSSLWYFHSSAMDIGSVEAMASRRALKAFIQTSQHNCTGNLVWSLATPRYGVKAFPKGRDGAFKVQL